MSKAVNLRSVANRKRRSTAVVRVEGIAGFLRHTGCAMSVDDDGRITGFEWGRSDASWRSMLDAGDSPRVPRAIEAQSITLAKALSGLSEIDEWWSLSVGEAVMEMMRISGGRVNPSDARAAFVQAVGELGLDVVEEST